MPRKLKQALILVLKLIFAAALILWLVYEGALDFSVLKRMAQPVVLLTSLLLVFISFFINNLRWLLLLRGQGFQSSVGQTLPLSLIGIFFNFAMPGGVGGDVVKGYYLTQDHPEKKLAAIVSIFMDRMMGFFVMVATGAIAIFFNWSTVAQSPQLTTVAFGVGSLFIAFLLFYAIALSRRVRNSRWLQWILQRLPLGAFLQKTYDALHAYRTSWLSLVHAFFLSAISQLLMILFVILVGTTLGVTQLPLSAYFFLVPIGVVITALPISPAGIGVGQAAFYFLFNLYLKEESQLGPTAVTALQICQFFWGLFGAYFYLHRKKPSEMEQGPSRASTR